MLEAFDLPYNTHLVGLYSGTMAADLAHIAPARTVPAMRTPQGGILTDSLAMAETLVEQHPDVPLLPHDPAARALARSMIAEMHSGFMALREACPNIITHVWEGFEPSQAVRKDLARIELFWTMAKERYGQDGPWLFGDYTLADVFYAPVACRMTTYQLPASKIAKNYIAAHLNDPHFLTWRKDALTETHDPYPYNFDLARKPWPVNGS